MEKKSSNVDIAKSSHIAKRTNSFLKFCSENKGFTVGFVVMVVIALIVIFAPVLVPNDPREQNPSMALLPPFVNAKYLLGTDFIGRCLLSRMIYGIRTSLLLCATSIPLSLLLGVGVGVISGMSYPGKLDAVLMRIVDVQMGFPFIVLVIMMIALFGQSIPSLILVLGLSFWAATARETRGNIMLEHSMDYVSSAKLMGASRWRIATKYHFRNLIPGILPIVPMNIASVIVLESLLSYMGLGIQPPQISLGNIMGDGKNYIATHWWVTAMGGILIIIMSISLTLIGDALHKRYDSALGK